MKVEITKHQLLALIEMKDTAEAMLGCADPESDKDFKKFIRAVNTILKKNDIKHFDCE